jgi:hypothetical protein
MDDWDVVAYDYDEFSIRIEFRNHIVREWTIEDVNIFVLNEMKRLADLGVGLGRYLKTRAVFAAPHREWSI